MFVKRIGAVKRNLEYIAGAGGCGCVQNADADADAGAVEVFAM